MAALRYGLDADDPGVVSICVGEWSDELFRYGWVLGERVLELEGIVLVLFDGE